MFGKTVLLLIKVIFITWRAIKCQDSFCSDRKVNLQKDTEEFENRCQFGSSGSPCCEAEKSSINERWENLEELCLYQRPITDITGKLIRSQIGKTCFFTWPRPISKFWDRILSDSHAW